MICNLICLFYVTDLIKGKIQALKKSATKGDKKKKKEVQEEIARLESEMDKRHDEELAEVNGTGNNANVSNP